MDKETREVVNQIQEKQALMVEQLQLFCSINSGSSNLSGLNEMSKLIQASYLSIADEIQTIDFPKEMMIDMSGKSNSIAFGQGLFIRKRPLLKNRILLSGHMDTVYGADHPFQTLKYINENQINGPGVADMKGGLIVMQQALEHFEQSANAKNVGWDVFINSDEELGSPASASHLEKIASNYLLALIYEPAMTTDGLLAKNRKSSGKYTLIAHGRAAHAGRDFSFGRNAICYLAEALLAIHQLNGQRQGLSINVGKIAGGGAVNMVPDRAVAKLDIRSENPEDESWLKQKFIEIQSTMQKKDYNLEVHGGFQRPAKRVNQATTDLFNRIKQAGNKLGLTIDWKDSGGCCDGNNLAKSGLAVIDSLGVRGGQLHTPEEFILLDSLAERSALSCLLLMDIAKYGFTS